jgi:hypothetical protein
VFCTVLISDGLGSCVAGDTDRADHYDSNHHAAVRKLSRAALAPALPSPALPSPPPPPSTLPSPRYDAKSDTIISENESIEGFYTRTFARAK